VRDKIIRLLPKLPRLSLTDCRRLQENIVIVSANPNDLSPINTDYKHVFGKLLNTYTT